MRGVVRSSLDNYTLIALSLIVLVIAEAVTTFRIETLAIIEHLKGDSISWVFGYGPCRVCNVAGIHGNGVLLRGSMKHPDGKTVGHVRGSDLEGRIIDGKDNFDNQFACYARFHIKNFEIEAIEQVEPSKYDIELMHEDERYIRAALFADRIKEALHLNTECAAMRREKEEDAATAKQKRRLAAGQPIYYTLDEDPGQLIKEYPDGSRQIVRFPDAEVKDSPDGHRQVWKNASAQEVVVKQLPPVDPSWWKR